MEIKKCSGQVTGKPSGEIEVPLGCFLVNQDLCGIIATDFDKTDIAKECFSEARKGSYDGLILGLHH